MIKALRITLSGNIPYQDVTIYDYQDQANMSYPDLFEDSQLVFTCKQGTFVLPDYKVVNVHLRRGRITPPGGALKVKRILLADNLNYQHCSIVDSQHWAGLGVSQIFRYDEQLVFICKDGLFVCPDFQVRNIQLS